MTDFEKKRLEYFIKAAKNYDWVRLGPGDVSILGIVQELHSNYEQVEKLKAEILKTQEEMCIPILKIGS